MYGNSRSKSSLESHKGRRATISKRGFQLVVFAILLLAGAAVYSLSSTFNGARTQSTTSSNVQGNVIMSLGEVPRILGPGTTMNYTLTLFLSAGVSGPISLTSTAPAELSVRIDPATLTPLGEEGIVDVQVHAASTVESGDYLITFRGNWSTGSGSLAFHFSIVQNLIFLLGGPIEFSPQNLTISVGSNVTWLSLVPRTNEEGQTQIRSVEILGPNVTSPALNLYDTWAYTFTQAGTYHYTDPLNPNQNLGGTIIVSGG